MLGSELLKQVRDNLDALELCARQKSKQLVLQNRSGSIAVLEALNIPCDDQMANALARHVPFLQKYSGAKPSTLLELVIYAGGINKCIEKLVDFRQLKRRDLFEERLQEQAREVIDYFNSIETALVLAKGKTGQKKVAASRSTSTSLPFCAFCFKRVFRSQYYCEEHHPSRNAEMHKRYKRRLFSAVYRHCDNHTARQQLDDIKNKKMQRLC